MHESDRFLFKAVSVVLAFVLIPLLVLAFIKGSILKMLLGLCIFGIAMVYLAGWASSNTEIKSTSFVGSFFEIWYREHPLAFMIVVLPIAGTILYFLAIMAYFGVIKLLQFF